MQETAADVFAEFQQGVAVLVQGASEYTLTGVLRTVAEEFVDGLRVKAGMEQLNFAVPPVTPTLSDRVRIDGRLRTPVRMKKIPAMGIPVAFVFVLDN